MSFSQVTDVEIVAVASGVPTSTNNRSSVAGSGTHGTADGHFLVTWRAGLTDDNPSNYDPYSFSYALFDPVTGSTVASGLLGEAIIGPSEGTLVGAPLFLGHDLIAFESSTYPYDYFSYHVEIRNPTGAPYVLPDTLVNFMPLFVLADGTLVATGTGPFQYVAVYNPVTRSVAAEYNLSDPFLFVTSVSGVDIGDDRSVLLFETASLSNDVWAAYYDPAASSGSNPFRLNTLEWNSSGPQAWSLGGNDVLFAWNDGGSDGSGGTVRGRVVDPDGPGGSADVVLTTTTAGNQTLAGGEVLADGRVLVVWQDELSDGSGNALRGRIVDPTDIDGSVDFRINTSVAGNQTLLDLTLLDDGRILATWADTENGATGANIRARIINPANPANTFDFQINTTLPGNQTLAATTALADGRQFYLWNSTAGVGSGSAVYGRFLDPSNPGGSTDFVVNTTTLGHQNGAELHVMDDGSLLVIWLDHSTGHASYRMRLIDPTDPSASSEQVLAASPGAQSNLHVEILGDGRIGFSWDELQGAATSVRSVIWSLDAPDAGIIRLGGNGDDTFVGSAFADTLRGGPGSDTLIANAGDDFLHGGAGDDILRGGPGADHMMGALGDDTYYVDSAGDVVDEGPGSGGVDTVVSSISFSLAASTQVIGQVENLTLADVGNTNALGNGLDNVLTGNVGNNTLIGYAGADTMRGLGGNDLYGVDNVGDIVDESVAGSNGIDTVNASISININDAAHFKGSIENASVIGSGNLSLTGNTLGNILTGNAGANVITGWYGNDTMTGGGGNDVFQFNSALNAATNVDAITDMNQAGNDTIRLENAIFTTLAAGALAASAFHVGAAAADANDRIIYNSVNGQLSYDVNGNAAGGSTLFAILDLGLTLAAADFFVV